MQTQRRRQTHALVLGGRDRPLCKEIKNARNGKYPPDWHAAVNRRALYDEHNLPAPRCDDLDGLDPEIAEFMRRIREAPLPDYARSP